MTVYQYEVILFPDVQETYEIYNILSVAKKSLSLSIGIYTISGRTIFTPIDLEEDV